MSEEPVHATYQKLRAAQRRHPFPSLDERRDWLERLERMLTHRREDLVGAIEEDFSGRCRAETLLADVVATLETIRHARRKVASWMRPRRVEANVYFRPSRARVEYLPKGVVGIIAPWNYPVNLALAPLAAALAAGNRALLKPSELTPRTSRLLADALRDTFTAEEVAVVEGGPAIAESVTRLPLDHLFFTGSTAVGAKVAQAAGANLVPTTLELGGKSPALVHPDYPLAKAAERIALGKLFNAGQTCIAPDYALISEGQERAFENAFRAAVERAYPDLEGPGYTAMASERGLERMRALVADAQAKGARVEVIAPGGQRERGRRMAPTLVFRPTEAMRVMQEEIFGPILPVETFGRIEDAIASINARPKPLAFYYFDRDLSRVDEILRRVPSGGACVNDALVHFAQEELPFGGAGPSGHGAYHGFAGFETFSHVRGVLVASALSPARRIQPPPYGALLEWSLDFVIRGFRRHPRQ